MSAKVKEKHMVIGFTVVCSSIFVLFSSLSYRRWNDLETLRKKNQVKEVSIKKEEKRIKEIEQFNSEILQLTRDYYQFAEVLPDNKKLGEFYLAVRDVSDELQIPPFGFYPKSTSVVKGKRGRNRKNLLSQDLIKVEIPIDIEVTFEQLGQFMNRIESYQRLISIKDLNIKSNNAVPVTNVKKIEDLQYPEENLLEVKMKLETYVYTAELEKQLSPFSTGNGPSSQSISRYTYTPDASRDPFIYIVQFKEKDPESLLPLPGKEVLENEKDICDYYNLDSRCEKNNNKVSDYCQTHFLLLDEMLRQEKGLKKAKELIAEIEYLFQKNREELPKKYSQIEQVLQYPYKVEWIKLEIQDIKGRYFHIKSRYQKKYQERILKEALTLKEMMMDQFETDKFLECLATYKKISSLLNTGDTNKMLPETQTVLSEARNLKEKAKIHLEFSELPLEITGIIWQEKTPTESIALIDGKAKGVEDSVRHGARIAEIKKSQVVFAYRGERISRSFIEREY